MKKVYNKFHNTTIQRRPTESGQSIEEQIRQAIATNSPLEGKAPMIYTPAADGIRPEYDIRTDKHDLALLANDKYQASEIMKSFIQQTEYDENGFDGKGNKRPEPQVETQKTE